MRRKMLTLVLAAALTASTVLTGCGGSTSTSSKTATTKVLTYSRAADSRGLDPAYVDDGESAKVMCNIFEGLVKYKDDSTEIQPGLATSWDISSDGKTYTFHLRKNVKFHDGTPFNADAVKFSIERQLPPNATDDMPYASFTFDPTIVDKVQKVDDYTVKILLKKPYTPFLANLAMALAAPIVSPTAVKKYGTKFTENPVGTGPFKFVSWQKDQSITLEKNNDYWGSKAKVDKVVFKVTKEGSVRASELITGSADIIDGVDPNDIKKIQDSKMELFKNKGMNINYMAFNCSRAPFNNAKLREAVTQAINRDELVKYLYQGYADVANSEIPTFIPGYNPDVKPYGYDTEKAKSILSELGKSNMKVKIITYSNARPYNTVNGQKLAEAVQNYLSKVGITAEIQVYPWTEYKDKVKQGEGDIMFYGWIGDNGDADNFLSLLDSNQIKSSLNAAMYSNPAVDALLEKGRTLANGNERIKAYQDVQTILAKDAPWVPISSAEDLAAYSPKVKGFKLHPTGVVFLQNVDKE